MPTRFTTTSTSVPAADYNSSPTGSPLRNSTGSKAKKRNNTSSTRDDFGAGPGPNPGSSPLQPSRSANLSSVSFSSSSGSASNLKSNSHSNSRMNDDQAEKASRRKSAHFGDLEGRTGGGVGGEGGRSGHPKNVGGGGGNQGRRVVSALAVQALQHQHQQQQQQGASSSGPGAAAIVARRGKRISAVMPVAAAPAVALQINTGHYDEWMKMAIDNKITATNTWNFALIDYFADLTLLRNDDDQSINFQKASSTLDGCVKIWTSRVDSVATETGKLLSGLAGGKGDDIEEEGEDADGAEPKEKRKTHRSEATLAKDFGALKLKKFDLEFTVDPLFKKTSADFDEGGAQGLLMNHLGVDGKGRVVFDAGDATIGEEDDELAPIDEELVDLSKLKAFIPSTAALASLKISEALSSFRFSSDPDAMPDFSTLMGLKDSWDDEEVFGGFGGTGAGPSVPTGEEQDFFGGEDFDTGIGAAGQGGFDDAMSMAGDDDNGDFAADGPSAQTHYGGALGMGTNGESFAPFDPRRQGGELVMAMSGGDGDDGEGMFDYFDKGLGGKGWAGAEHWKLRKVTRKDVSGANSSNAPKAARTAKAPFSIDFTSDAAAQTTKALFAPATKSNIMLPAAIPTKSSSSKRKRTREPEAPIKRKDEWLLPDDMHFSSRQLLRLFLKPKFALRMRRNASTLRVAQNGTGEIDENFWAQAAADRVDGNNPDDNGNAMPIPFESQFFHDDGGDADGDGDDAADYAFVDGDLDLPGSTTLEDDDLLAGTQGQVLRRTRPENVHFAKKAKRVDVKRLKDDIWQGLKVVVPDEPDADIEMVEPGAKTFDTVIQDLRQAYPREKMSEISTSFCFICLLHLANEEGLRIETARFDGQDDADVGCVGIADIDPEDDGTVGGNRKDRRLDKGDRIDRTVGELQALRVYKDPNAGRAA